MVTYGDGTLYDQGIYGRISAGMAAAQLASVRSTGLKVTLIDERVNRWESVNDVGEVNTLLEYYEQAAVAGHRDPTLSNYWAYRGGSDVVKLSGGTVVRVRVGTPGNYNDRQIYYQEITDPSNAAQWQSWTLLYSGNHFYAIIVPTGASTYDVYHIKAGAGFCKNNSTLVSTADDGVPLDRGVRIVPVIDETGYPLDDYFIITVPRTHDYDSLRVLDFYICDGLTAYYSTDNYEWYRNTAAVVVDPNATNEWFYFHSFPMHTNPRAEHNGESITVSKTASYFTDEMLNPPALIRGLGGRAGFNIIDLYGVHLASDGYFYLFYGEFHADDDYQAIQSGQFIFWQRSKDALHWSEPVLIGYSLNGFAGVFEDGGYLYACGNGEVIRRPMTAQEYVLDNYVPEVNFELPRNNESGRGSCLVANPDRINDDILELSDRRIRIEPGIKLADGQYEYKQMADLWAKKITETNEAAASRIQIDLGDVWSRLEQPLRDTFNIIGQTQWDDWKEGEPNELFNYYFEEIDDAEVDGNQIRIPSGGRFLWTGWKGHNPDFTISYSGVGTIQFYFRYVDEENYHYFTYNGSNLILRIVRNGVETDISTTSISSHNRLRFYCRWGLVQVYSQTGTLLASISLYLQPEDMIVKPGYVGFGGSGNTAFSNFHFVDWEYNLTSHDLVRFALAMGDYHDVVVGGPDSRQYALIWGPQTDLPTAADGLRQILEAEKLEVIWRDGFIEVGQFKNLTPVLTIEDRIIETTFKDEAKRRINLAIVDGNEHSWFEADAADSRQRDRQIVAYYDLPELMTQQAVRDRAIEEIRVSSKGQVPGGRTPLFFDLRRMDPIIWVDNLGRTYEVRIEGISVDINQSTAPKQNMTLDTSLL